MTELPDGLVSRPLVRDDLPAVLDVMREHEEHVLGEAMVDLEDLEADWERPSFDAAADTVAVLEGERLVAYGEVYRNRRAEIYVHPRWCGRGIGTALMRWSWRRVQQAGAPLVGQTVPDAAHDAVELFRRHGYSPLWTSWVLALPPEARVPQVDLPPGYRIRSFRPGSDEQAVYRVVEDAFNEWPDRDPSSYGDWAAGVLGRPGFEPWQLFLAVRTEPGAGSDEVVGVCHLVLSGGSGWVNQLAVAAPHRGQRLAQALLAVAFAAARERGSPRGELSTDSRTGALGLYEHIGMHVTAAFTQWVKRLSPQDDAGERGPDAATVASS